MDTKERKYATIGNPTINAVIKQLYRFDSIEQAEARLVILKQNFVTSKVNKDNDFIVWLRGYEVSDEEIEKGFLGHYAQFICIKTEDNKYTIGAKKLDIPLDRHPQKKRPTRRHPDWGHQVLRDIKKRKIYFTLEDALEEFQKLQIEYPEVSIPTDNGLLIMIYEKPQIEGDRPIHKYKFMIKPTPEGAFYITYKSNEKVKVAIPKIEEELAEGEESSAKPKSPAGYFTAMVSLKKKKRPSSTSNAGNK